MIIRSQDKSIMTNFKNITDIGFSYEEESKYMIVAYLYQNSTILATYSTEEKAIKVLDMIQERYQSIWDAENGYLSGGQHFGLIFKMPQDDEI